MKWQGTLQAALLLLCAVVQTKASDTCNRHRKVLTDSWGIITDGNDNYRNDSHCEWLVRANSSESWITLKFQEMDTECAYDHVFVYDGDSYDSLLLGSFSGTALPPIVTASSGSMLILLYSDTNYVLKGFTAEYSITECPLNCSGKGSCTNGSCDCTTPWTGIDCSYSPCPENCNENLSQGNCTEAAGPQPACRCSPGFSGLACSLPDVPSGSVVGWHLLSRHLPRRAGHAGLYVADMDQLYVFGGRSFNQVFGDFVVYNFNESTWHNLSDLTPHPSPRWGHAMALHGLTLVLHGGETADGSLSSQLWFYSVVKREWSLENAEGNLPPPVAMHSLTLVDDRWLYLFGGRTNGGAFLGSLFRLDPRSGSPWERVRDGGGGPRLVGHAAVFDANSRSLLVHGGVIVDYARFSKLSAALWAFGVDSNRWTKLEPARSAGDPMERAFHAAGVVGDFLLVVGGYMHRHSKEEKCFDDALYLYDLHCHKWVPFQQMAGESLGKSRRSGPAGLHSHVAAFRRDHTLLVLGGYRGLMSSELWALHLPASITRTDWAICVWHRTKVTCKSNPACAWCNDSKMCLDRRRSEDCPSGLFGNCPGLCPALTDCQSCMAWGQAGQANAIRATRGGPRVCGWCVEASKCHPISDPPAVCRGQEEGYWGPQGHILSSLPECRTVDFRPGLLLLRYRYPANLSQPDEVSYVNSTKQSLVFVAETQDDHSQDGGEHMGRLLGFLHPWGVRLPPTEPLRLFLSASDGRAVLRLSLDDQPQHLEVVGNRTSHGLNRTEAVRPGGRHLLPPIPRDRYLLDFRLYVPAKFCHKACDKKMLLEWNAVNTPSLIPVQYLEPYLNGLSCGNHTNCMACLSDAACGWCRSSDTCIPRRELQGHACAPTDQNPELLVLDPAHCISCSMFIYCEDCASGPSCEWIVEGAYCIRRGRSDVAVRRADHCPVPCHLRESCVSCLGDPGRCAWCEQTQSCFLFSTYTTSFMFAGCREWVDEDHLNPKGTRFAGGQCPNCSALGDCGSCLQKLGCGWCSNDHNPSIGVCVPGSFAGPIQGNCSRWAEKLDHESTSWSYARCPNIDECKLGLARCHADAGCVDDLEGYHCVCNKGFKGDGNTTCLKTCAEPCVHGYCSEAPDYRCLCALGWTGARCDVDCGCHNHSRCERGVGTCDHCQDLTEGTHCHLCRRGAFGNATTPFGCRKCSCNGHGNDAAGTCEPHTGHCRCLHNTEGKHCELCKPGFFGDPRNKGRCYKDCSPKGRIQVEAPGGLGSPLWARPTRSPHCLWILETGLGRNCSIELTLLPGLHIRCPENHVYVYDGLPPFVRAHSSTRSNLLGAFCGTNTTMPVVVTSSGAQLSIYFRRSRQQEQGFNATYRPVSRSASCPLPSVARSRPCRCSASALQGSCDEVYRICRCKSSFGGSDCSIPLRPQHLSWELLFDLTRVARADTAVPDVHFGHSLLALEPNQLWLFGGTASMTTNSDALYVYFAYDGRWNKVLPQNGGRRTPPGRRFHGAAMVGRNMYIFGGINSMGVLGDFWKFSTHSYTWTEVMTSPDVPALAGLTLTNVGDEWLVLVGGFSPKDGFQEKTLMYGLTTGEWKVLNTSGTVPIGIYGHTSNYHAPTKSIYVFGGVVYDVDHTVVSGTLYALHFPTRRWSRLPPDERANPVYSRVSARYFHTSSITERSLFVVGGRNGSGEAILEPFAYDFSCNRWVSLEDPYIQQVGGIPDPISGGAIAHLSGHLYMYGGSSERPHGLLYRLTVPDDICVLFSGARLGCLRHVGCSYCSVQDIEGNHTHCYSSSSSTPASCIHHQGTLEVAPGKVCDAAWLDNRNCIQYETCEDCLASWPVHPEAQHACEWCTSCRKGHCIRSGQSSLCEQAVDCDGPQPPLVADPSQCPLRSCLASECEKCRDLGKCIWTRQAVRSSELRHTLNVRPIFDWTCVRRAVKDASSFPVESNPPRPCPIRCFQHPTCSSCLASVGGEGGWHQCWWSTARHECLTPSYAALRCEGGGCGAILQGSASCDPPCHVHLQAAHCLGDPHCGWCGFRGPGHNGHGVCMRGNALGPTGGVCMDGNVFIEGHPLPANVSQLVQTMGSRVGWYYYDRLPENECTNGHHNCHHEKEKCVDLPDGFSCECNEGYVLDSAKKECKPVCSKGCEHGVCIHPDVCRCDFGYVGHNCSLACQCNGHSECAGPHLLDLCTKCHNHTMGKQCHLCEPFYVGNPAKGGRCIPCLEYCHHHTNICVEASQLELNESAAPTDFLQSFREIEHGPTDSAECRFCKNNTTGAQCEECMEGYFVAGKSIDQGCRPCECHGHGYTCDWRTGEYCNCMNNTENDRQCSKKNSKNSPTPCWHLQCSKCKESFMGAPTDGHQCYRTMRLETEYCFDPDTQECNSGPNPLPAGRTIFFAVHPRYMNVDIRIIVDVLHGAADLYLSNRDDTFVVDVNRTSGVHVVSVDTKYTLTNSAIILDRKRRHVSRNITEHLGNVLLMHEKHASTDGPAVYVTVRDQREVLLVHNLQSRLVITIPQHVFDLRTTKIYMVLVGTAKDSPLTIGNIFFRQDQTRIDLFVFFSVFFSCFFLFLAACVVVWKVKRAFDVRHARRLHAAQMEHMARRPFARVCLGVDDRDVAPCRKKKRAKDSPKALTCSTVSGLRPVAVEPTEDGAAAVTTLLVQLPGGLSAPVRLSLGSALVSVRGGGMGSSGIRAAMRRRTSHVNL